MAVLTAAETEIRDQSHEMWAEGSSDDQPTVEEVVAHVLTYGYTGYNTDVFFDTMQKTWRWSCDIRK